MRGSCGIKKRTQTSAERIRLIPRTEQKIWGPVSRNIFERIQSCRFEWFVCTGCDGRTPSDISSNGTGPLWSTITIWTSSQGGIVISIACGREMGFVEMGIVGITISNDCDTRWLWCNDRNPIGRMGRTTLFGKFPIGTSGQIDCTWQFTVRIDDHVIKSIGSASRYRIVQLVLHDD